jgi:hypothetical protein
MAGGPTGEIEPTRSNARKTYVGGARFCMSKPRRLKILTYDDVLTTARAAAENMLGLAVESWRRRTGILLASEIGI